MPDSDYDIKSPAVSGSDVNDDDLEDESGREDGVAPVKFDITSYGVDFDVFGLYRRLKRGEIVVPSFQRDFVWTLRKASRFIESLLLGLPVPGIFLASDSDSGELLVIDGQQRLKSLMFFYDGVFNPGNGSVNPREFKLRDVQETFDGRTYESLDAKDRLDLDNSVIHATVVKQDSPTEDDTSIYHIFERLNSGGRRLHPQEMRTALYQGPLIDTVRELNHHPTWRNIYGNPGPGLRDQELVLRFLALSFSEHKYSRPLQEFLTKFVAANRNPAPNVLEAYRKAFTQVADLWWNALDSRAFRPFRALNVAVFDSMFRGLYQRIVSSNSPEPAELARAYDDLLQDVEYLRAVKQATSSEWSMQTRMEKATNRMAQS